MDITELTAMSELSNQLNTADIIQIRDKIGLPEALCTDSSKGTEMIIAIKGWKGNDSFQFHQALESVRPDLTTVACKIPWLCSAVPNEGETEGKKPSITTLIDLLKTEITKDKWNLIYISITNEVGENVDFETTVKFMLTKGLINKDLNSLSILLKGIQREDLVNKMKMYQNLFSQMEDEEFISKFRKEVDTQIKIMSEWETHLKQFLQIKHRTVKQMLGKDESVSLAQVFVDLTILKEKPRPINLEDETTYSEISYLRKIANKEVEIEPVDFTEELKSYEYNEPEIWCIIGNPGCGKTFLAKRTALRFSESEIESSTYSISIPCRHPGWHEMESTRYDTEQNINKEFISEWLCLGLPKGPNWSKDLSKHLTESDGECLLLIIDGLDEFTKKMQFKYTFLFQLLTRESLTRSTIILTSRPGAWTDISSSHELKIDRYYQVLGFSPKNRDLYFEKQIKKERKLDYCKELLAIHDEMNQLSLIPVNASLFAALLKGENSSYFNTLSKLYYELTLYLIRRQLSRMGLEEYAGVIRISELNEGILQCLHNVGFFAHLGVANRELTSSENFPLIIDNEEYPSHCLGLVHEHYKVESVGITKRVWTFPHLTMQEFTSAVFLASTRWTDQCFSVGYISYSNENFSLFKMVVRFLCGLLCDESAAVLSILYRYLPSTPVPMNDFPMTYQLNFDGFTSSTGWFELTELYLLLIAILFETSSLSIHKWFDYFRDFFPDTLYIFILSSISPNEWLFFLQSLEFICRIQVLYIDTDYINTTQFKSLVQKLSTNSISHFVLRLYDKDSTTVLSYNKLITEAVLKCDTKISIELSHCNLTEVTDVNHLFPINNLTLYFVKLYYNEYSVESLQQLSKQFSTLDYLVLYEYEENDFSSLLPAMCQATQLKGVYLDKINEDSIPHFQSVLNNFSNLQEIDFSDSTLLREFHHLSSLSYIRSDGETEDTTLCYYLLKLLNNNTNTLRGVVLCYLNRIGIRSWTELLDCLQLCNKLVEINLHNTYIYSSDVTQWCTAVSKCQSLVKLYFYEVTLHDRGFIAICEGLVSHPAIRNITVIYCEQTSESCEYLMYLIPTLSQLKSLEVNNLSTPDDKPLKDLLIAVDQCCIELELS